jgi:hypothetical protein
MALINRSSKWFRLVSLSVVGIAFIFIGKVFFGSLDNLSLKDLSINYAYLSIALFACVGTSALATYLWYLILRLLGEKPSFRYVWRVTIYTSIVRYLPGRIWGVMGRLHWGAKLGISEKKLLLSTLLENAFLFVGGIITSLYCLKLFVPGYYAVFSVLFTACILLMLHPRILARGASIVGRKWIKEPVVLNFGYSRVLLLALCYTLLWVVLGVQFYVFVRSFYPLALHHLPNFVSFNSASWVIGYITLVTPGGLGIKEGVFVYVFKTMVPVPIAILAAVLLRIYGIVTEVIAALIVFAFDRGAWQDFFKQSKKKKSAQAPREM